MSLPKILHIAPSNISGVPGQFVEAERRLGYESYLVTLFQDSRGYKQDLCLNLPLIDFYGTKKIKKVISNPNKIKIDNKVGNPDHVPVIWQPYNKTEKLLISLRDKIWQPRVERAIRKFGLDTFDVYQLDGGLGLYRNSSFVQKMKQRNKPVICCYLGSDLRTRGVIKEIDDISDLNITVEFDHLKHHHDIHHLFFPFTTHAFQRRYQQNEDLLRIGHAPTNFAAKGSDVILATLNEIRNEYRINIVLIYGLSHINALQLKRSCDIFIDQLGDLGYGINSLEALAMEVPTCTSLSPRFSELYPDHPFVEINADNIHNKVVDLIVHENKRKRLGKAGKKWVEKYHNAESIVRSIHNLLAAERKDTTLN